MAKNELEVFFFPWALFKFFTDMTNQVYVIYYILSTIYFQH